MATNDNSRVGQRIEGDHVRGSAVIAVDSSLSAPNRSRSICVDDFRDSSYPAGGVLVELAADAISSESDDDENEDISRRLQKKPSRNGPGLRRRRRTSSALSLESLQNDSDNSGSSLDRRKRPMALNIGENRAEAGEVVEEVQLVSESPAKRQKVTGNISQGRMGPDLGQMPADISQGVHARAKHVVDATVNNSPRALVSGSAASHAQTAREVFPENSKSAEKHAVQARKRVNVLNINNEGVELSSNFPARGALITQKSLTNIASVPEKDATGWDRYIFFSYRPQRFAFPRSTYISAFSPFSAVAVGMVGVTAAGVCAVCGSGQALVKCCRCPLAFHSRCIDPRRVRMGCHPWFCDACQAVKGEDRTESWHPLLDPPPLPSPSKGLARLIVDAKEGNPIDFVFHPTLYQNYRSECGRDWLRCSKCNEIVLLGDGVLAESVHAPFECGYAFWRPVEDLICSNPRNRSGRQSQEVEAIESYIRGRSRRRNALFYNGFGEEDREDYGYPALARNTPVDDVIVIDEEDSEPVLPTLSLMCNERKTGDMSVVEKSVQPVQRTQPKPHTAMPRLVSNDKSGIDSRKEKQGIPTVRSSETQVVTPASRSRANEGRIAEGVREKQDVHRVVRAAGKLDRNPLPRADIPMSIPNEPAVEVGSSFGRPRMAVGDKAVGVLEGSEGRAEISAKAAPKASERPNPGFGIQGNREVELPVPNRGPEFQATMRLETQVPSGLNRFSQPLPPTPTAPERPLAGGTQKNGVKVKPQSIDGRPVPAVGGVVWGIDVPDAMPFNSDHGVSATVPSQMPMEVKREDEADNRGVVGLGSWTADKTEDITDMMMACITKVDDFDVDIADCLTDMAFARDNALFRICRHMGGTAWFKRQATRLARRRMAKKDPESVPSIRTQVQAFPQASPGDPSTDRQLECDLRVRQLQLRHEGERRELYEALHQERARHPNSTLGALSIREASLMDDLFKRQQTERAAFFSAAGQNPGAWK